MNCYVHNDKYAVGMCVGCGKPICKDCATELHEKLYCKKCIEKLLDQKDKEIEKAEGKPTQVFMNAGGGGGSSSSSSSSSSAAAAGGGYRGGRPLRPRNSVGVHILLFCFTAGIGNIIYYLYISGKQKQWDATYRY